MPETSQPTEAPIEFTFSLNEAEAIEFAHWKQVHGPHARVELAQRSRSIRRRVIAVAVVTFIMVTWVLVLPPTRAPVIARLGFGLSSVVTLGLWLWLQMGLSSWRTGTRPRELAIQAQVFLNRFAPPRVARIHLDRSGVTQEEDDCRVTFAWRAYTALYETKLLLISQLRTGEMGFLPKRLLGEREVGGRNIELIKRWLHEGGGGQMQRLPALLASSARRCPLCRYSLQGLCTPNCPECGLDFDPAFFPE